MSRRQSKTVDEDQGTTRTRPVLPPDDDDLAVGDGVREAAKRQPTRPKRPPFGSYMDRELQKEFKMACIVADVEMQDGLDQAVRMWLEKQQRANRSAG